jgi:S1-C subfamily serine protease
LIIALRRGGRYHLASDPRIAFIPRQRHDRAGASLGPAQEKAAMSTRIVCPHCRAANQVSDELLGKKIRCRRCDEVVLAVRPEDDTGIVDERPRRARRLDPEDDDLVPAGRSRRRRRRKRGLSGLAIFAAMFSVLVIVVAGGLIAYFAFGHTPATHADGRPQGEGAGPPPLGDERPLIERQAHLEAWFRAPEEPPTGALKFTEPPPGDDPAAGGGNAGEPVHNATGQLTPEVLKKIKESTVYIEVQRTEGKGSGSGFLAGEPGFVVTNAHVVGMLNRAAPPPTSVKVVRNKGEANEATLAAQVVAVDPDEDLALLSVPKEGLPPPLVVKSALRLRETQPVYVAGFPLGEKPGKNVTINKYELSSLKKENGVLERLQVHGDMVFGNSGGPLLDADGDVVGACVSILTDPRVQTRINFAIPGDKVLRFLNGRFADLTLEAPSRADGRLRVPVAVKVIDPVGRVSQVAVDVWVGQPGQPRAGSRTRPKPLQGDGDRQTFPVEVKQQAGRGELVLPELRAGAVYWMQPCLISRTGGRVWLSAQLYRPPAPVERKPARLAWEPAGDWPLVLERWSSLQFSHPDGSSHHALLALEARLTESARERQGNDRSMFRQFTGFKEGVAIDGHMYMTGRLPHLGPHIQLLADNLVADAQGTTKKAEFDPKLKDAPSLSKRHLIGLQQEMAKFLQGLEVPLPGREVQPGETWKATPPLPIDAAWKLVDSFQSQVWTTAENESLEVTYTYSGLRTVDGAERAVIQLKGQAAPRAGLTAWLSGTATVDLATGQIIDEEVTAQANADLVVLNTTAARAQGTVVARLRRE